MPRHAAHQDVLAAGVFGMEPGPQLEDRRYLAVHFDRAGRLVELPARILSSVLLPAPFGPMTPTTSPLDTWNDTSLRAWNSWCRERPVSDSINMSMGRW